jgi:hypothetical protein
MASQITRKPLPRSAAYLKVASTFPDEVEPANPSNALLNVPAPTAVREHDAISSAAATPLQSDENIQAPSGIRAINPSDTEESTTLKHDTQSSSPIKYAKWGVHWRQPTYVLLCTLSAVALALGHHFYYASLSGTPAGSSRRQQWANAFGISFSYLVVHLLGISIAVTYSQYIWSIIRQRGYTLKALDDLFSMTSDPRGFLNLEILRYGRIAIPLGLIYWYVPKPNLYQR